jgi:two-component system cell cycle sensor histidine kinase/response regulator CckA
VLVQMRHLAKEMVRIARDTFPKNISINLDIPSNLWTVSGDPTQLHQVILNLCVNARDAVLSGGSITISAENETLSRPLSYLNYEIQPGRWVHLRVKDNGCGMKPETLERVFEPFFTTKDQGKGTGLGLPTILGIVKSHRGLITVDSAPGQGTIFHVYLPASEEGQDAFAGELKPSSSPPRGDGQTILVVDDETPVLEVTKHILNQYNYQVLLASDGAEAVALYARQPDKIALVVTDIMMPIMDGVALVRALHKINPEVKIIGSSGFVGDDSSGNRMEELKSLGVDTVLEKPFTSRDLLTTIATELNDQT